MMLEVSPYNAPLADTKMNLNFAPLQFTTVEERDS